MEGQEKLKKCRVIKINSKESWLNHISRATNQASPVMVHFCAYWCMPSVAMNPVFEELASTYHNVVFLTVDVDEVKEVASMMEIKAMPTFLVVSGGSVVDKIVGANPEELKKRIDAFLHSHQSHYHHSP